MSKSQPVQLSQSKSVEEAIFTTGDIVKFTAAATFCGAIGFSIAYYKNMQRNKRRSALKKTLRQQREEQRQKRIQERKEREQRQKDQAEQNILDVLKQEFGKSKPLKKKVELVFNENDELVEKEVTIENS